MYAITFNLDIDKLKKNYGEDYNKAYDEIHLEMDLLGFELSGNFVYSTKKGNDNLIVLIEAMDRLKEIEWFKNSVISIKAVKIEDWSDITSYFNT